MLDNLSASFDKLNQQLVDANSHLTSTLSRINTASEKLNAVDNHRLELQTEPPRNDSHSVLTRSDVLALIRDEIKTSASTHPADLSSSKSAHITELVRAKLQTFRHSARFFSAKT